MRLNYFILFFSLALFFNYCKEDQKESPTGSDNISTLKWLSAQGNKIINEDGQPVLLHGVNRSGLEYSKSGNGINQAEIEYMDQEWQVRIIRIPFNQDWMTNDPNYRVMVDQVVGWIQKIDAYVILDLQWQSVADGIAKIPNQAAIKMWQDVATRYKNNPVVLYDLHNEVHDTTFESWRWRASEIITAVQSVHPRALFLVSGMNWGTDLREWMGNPLPFDNVVYSVHFYPKWGALDEWDKKWGNFSEQVPVFLGEFGGDAAETASGDEIEWGKQLIRYSDQKDIGWTSWSWSDYPFLTYNDRRTPTEFGLIVQQALMRYAFPENYLLRISNVRVEYITAHNATINWNTNFGSDSRVDYGLSASYDNFIYAPVFLKTHTIKLTGLNSGTTYHFRITSKDEYGQIAETNDSTFTTLVGVK